MKKSEAKEYIKEFIVAELTEASATPDDIKNQSELNKELEKTKTLMADLVKEEDDEEPTAKDIAANASIAKLQSKYGEVVKQMKSTVNKYKSAEGAEKQKYVDQLKNLTKLKKELKL
jgi:CO dehydrogenase/acetyl-CoA synthase beta subunit